jgi:hypothetical protein
MPGAAVVVGSERMCERVCVSVRGYGCVCECTCVGGCLCVGVCGWVRVFEAVVVVVSVCMGEWERGVGSIAATGEDTAGHVSKYASGRTLIHRSSSLAAEHRHGTCASTQVVDGSDVVHTSVVRIHASAACTNRSRGAGWSAGVQAVPSSHSCTELFPQRLQTCTPQQATNPQETLSRLCSAQSLVRC